MTQVQPTKSIYKSITHKKMLAARWYDVILIFVLPQKESPRSAMFKVWINPADFYLFKVNNENTKTMYVICSNLTIKTQERQHWCRSGILIVNSEHISYFTFFSCFYCWLRAYICLLVTTLHTLSSFFFPAISLTLYKLLAIIEGTASFNQC